MVENKGFCSVKGIWFWEGVKFLVVFVVLSCIQAGFFVYRSLDKRYELYNMCINIIFRNV